MDRTHLTYSAATTCRQNQSRLFQKMDIILNTNHRSSAYCGSNFLSQKHKIYIKHAKNGGEVFCGKYLLDGVCEKTKTVYEFHGCYWHRFQKCYLSNTFNTHKSLLQFTVYKRHEERIKFIRNYMRSFKLVELLQEG